MGICEILTIIFVVCKLIGVIDWSWWLVVLPELIACIVYVVIWIAMSVKVHKASKRIEKNFRSWR